MQVLIAIKTTEVGVETFSLTLQISKNIFLIKIMCFLVKYFMYLNNKLRMENEQISTPLPVIAEKIPPKNPVRVNTIPCHTPKFGTESKVLLLCCLKQK